MFQFNIAIYLIILLSTIIGCDCNKLLNQGFSSDSKQDTLSPLFVLFHGLDSQASCFDSLKNELQQHFPDADLVALTSLETTGPIDHPTATASIKEQGISCFNELSEKIPDLQNRPILLIGHSQGGLRAYSMFHMYRDLLKIKGIGTIATPWEGAPIVSAAEKLLSHPSEWLKIFSTPVLQDMESLSKDCNEAPNWLEETLKSRLNNFNLESISIFRGIQDLKPGSSFLTWVKNKLPNAAIPILAIGGAENDFSVFLPQKSKHTFKTLREAWTKLVVDENDPVKKHDMVVPLSSQIARNIVPEGSQNFQRIVIQDAVHDEILGLPSHNKSKHILKHPAMFEAVKAFAKKVLYEDDSKKHREQKAAKAA